MKIYDIKDIERHSFRPIKDGKPPFDELFWAYSNVEKHVFFAKRERIEVAKGKFSEFYTVIEGLPYFYDHKIEGDTRLEHTCDITHWAKLPPLRL